MIQCEDLIYFPQVYEILQLPVFDGCRIIGGKEGVNRGVERVNRTDTEDYESHIEKGDLLITALRAISDHPEKLNHLVKNLSDKAVAGVLVKCSPRLPYLPQVLIQDADKYALPLIVMPESTDISESAKTVTDEIERRRTTVSHVDSEVNEKITAAVLRGDSLSEIAALIAENAHTSVVILDTVNRQEALALSPKEKEMFGSLPYEKQLSTVIEGSRSHEMVVGSYHFGHLFLYGTDLSTYMPFEVLRQILQTVPLEISRIRTERDKEDSGLTAYLAHLLLDNDLSEKQELLRAARFTLSPEEFYLTLHVTAAQNTDVSDTDAAHFSRALFLGSLKTVFSSHDLVPYVIPSGEDNYLVFKADNRDRLVELSEGLKNRLVSAAVEYTSLTIRIGVGRAFQGLLGISQSRREADVALHAAESSGEPLLCYENLGILRLVYSENPEKDMRQFVRERLGNLSDSEKGQNAELLKTLRKYFECFGNVNRVSKELFTHYNTVSYRLKNIREITGCNLSDPKDVFELQTALYLADFLKKG